MVYPHIQLITTTTSAQGFYLAQGRTVPQEIFKAFVAADGFDTNRQFWVQKNTGGALQRVRVDHVEPLDLPVSVATAALAIDTGRSHQKLRLFTGDTIGTAVAIEQDLASDRRWSVMFSLG